MRYSKLVRDRIPEIIEGKGKKPIIHIATEVEYKQKLIEKLLEETREFSESKNPYELADILEVIDAICETMSIKKEELLKTKKRRAQERGQFKKRIILKGVQE